MTGFFFPPGDLLETELSYKGPRAAQGFCAEPGGRPFREQRCSHTGCVTGELAALGCALSPGLPVALEGQKGSPPCSLLQGLQEGPSPGTCVPETVRMW